MKYCGEQGCRKNVVSGRYCDDHKRKSQNKGSSNKSFYNSQAWKDVKAYCYERDKGRCTKCNKFVYGHSAQHHHIIPIKENPKLKLDPDNITTLCPKCHMLEENNSFAKPKHNFNWGIVTKG